MNKRLLILGAMAIAFAGTTIMAADWWLENNIETVIVEKPVEGLAPVPLATIAVASQPLRYGETLTDAVVKEIPWPEGDMPEGAFITTEELLGDGSRIVLRPMAANEPILTTKVTGADDKGSLSRLLEPGERAVTISITDTTGVAGFVTPGDRVDLVLQRFAQDNRDENGGAGVNWLSPVDTQVRSDADQFSVATTILADVLVISIDQIVDQTQAEPRLSQTVTLALTPKQAKTVTAAQAAGTMHLHLRGSGETGDTPRTREIDLTPTAAFSAPKKADPTPPVSNKVDIVVRQGTETKTVAVPAERGTR
ncbi:MAG: Flp pilus assembly protein CpaB [Pseudomonadota bacterium]